jgi:putative drug exporter of the RND superfamily
MVRILVRIGRFSATHPWRAIGVWVALVAAAVVAGVSLGTEKLPNGAVGESRAGYTAIDRYQLWEPARQALYLHSDSQTAASPGFASAIAAAKRIAAPYSADPAAIRRRVSADGHSAVVDFPLRWQVTNEDVARMAADAQRAAPGIAVSETGDLSLGQQHDHAVNQDLHRAEVSSIPVTLIVLVVAFGALVAALVPVALAFSAVVVAMGLLAVSSQAWPIDNSTQTVVLLVGMAVGVDYSLFTLTRTREEQRSGLGRVEAAERGAATSGRTVVISGMTVIAAMAGLYLVRSDIFSGIATGTIFVVAAGVVGAVTVIPAVVALLGDRINRLRLPLLRRRGDRRLSEAVVERVLRRPRLSFALSAGLLVALAIPALGLHISKPSSDALTSHDLPAFSTLAAIRHDFAASGEPANIVVTAPAAERVAARREIQHLIALARDRGISHGEASVIANKEGTAARIDMPLTGDGSNEASYRALRALRDTLIPQTVGRVPGAHADVTGATAEDVDFSHQMSSSTPYVVAFVLTLAALLLLVAFRSVVIAVKAIVLNLLSVAASYGILVLVFQHSWAEGLLRFRSNGAIIAWLPLFLFVILFGLSMDYHVFILSRIREAVLGGSPTESAVRTGVAATAGVVTSAAAVMIAVFSIFATLSSLDLKQAGIGMAAAVLIDATVVRAVLLPASMTLLGDWNWYLPRWLGWLPRLEVEGPAMPAEGGVQAAAGPAAGLR